ncbi:MAG TPA: TonB-dependent receptor [Rhodocyclaceae bacterium]|nr:TonB-dependent receptor [Rhodocyclaceae bacterium]
MTTITVNADRSEGYGSNYVQVGAFRDQTILDTPSTVNVFPRAIIEAQNATGIFDVMKNSPGVTRSQTNGIFADNLTLRGLTMQNRSNFRLNGSLPLNNLISMPMENKERMEVLKGTSALYYGFTSPGGVVNLVTKRAGFQPNLSLQATYGEHGQLLGALDAGARFGEDNQFGLRLNLVGGQLGGYGIDHVEGERSLYSLAADWRVNDRVTLFFDYEYLSRQANEQAIIAVPGAVNGVIPFPKRPPPSNFFSPGRWAVTAGNAENVMGKATFALSDRWAASIEVGRAETNRTERALPIFTIRDLVTGDGSVSMTLNRGERYVNDNYRAEITGLIPMGRITNEVTFGVMRNERFQSGAVGGSVLIDPANPPVNPPGVGPLLYPQNLYNPILYAQRTRFNRPAIGFRPQNARDDGIYLFDRVRFNDQWQVVLGVRHSDYENISNPTPTTQTIYRAKETSPSASVVYQFRPHTSLYASYIEGLEEGETAPTLNTINPGEVFGPKISKQREIGIKTEVLDGVMATLAYFDMDVPTAGFRVPSSTPGVDLYVQEGQSSYKGFEFSVTGEITPALSIVLGGLLLDASQESASNPAQIGKVPDSTAERTYSAYLDYRPEWAKGFSISGGSFYTGPRPLGPTELGWLPGYTTHSAGLRYSTQIPGEHKLTLQLNVDNLTNKEYWSGGNSYLAVGLPRTTSFLVKLDWF